MPHLDRILLAEDNPTDIELTLRALIGLANKVDVARDGAEALDYLYCRGLFANRLPGNPALVVLDNRMPRIDGLEVLKRIRTDAKLKKIPVIMLTASREHGDFLKSHALGVHGYVIKPVNFCEFVTAVRDLGVRWAIVTEPPSDSLPTGSRRLQAAC